MYVILFDTIPAPLSSHPLPLDCFPPSYFHVCFECAHLISLACLSSYRVIYFWEGSYQWLYHSGIHLSLSLESLIAYSPFKEEWGLTSPLLPWWNVDGGLCLVQIGTSVVNSWAQQPCHAQSISDSTLALTFFLPRLPDSSLSLGDNDLDIPFRADDFVIDPQNSEPLEVSVLIVTHCSQKLLWPARVCEYK